MKRQANARLSILCCAGEKLKSVHSPERQLQRLTLEESRISPGLAILERPSSGGISKALLIQDCGTTEPRALPAREIDLPGQLHRQVAFCEVRVSENGGRTLVGNYQPKA
jgi:hypothetical protein